MKTFRIKKQKSKTKVKVIVIPEEDRRMLIPFGGAYDSPPVPPLPKPTIPRCFISKIKKPSFKGRVEFFFDSQLPLP